MTEQTISTIAGIIISLIFSYVPGAKDYFETIDSNKRRLVMLAILAVATAGIFGATCAGYSTGATCDNDGAQSLVRIFISAMIANQATFLVTPKAK